MKKNSNTTTKKGWFYAKDGSVKFVTLTTTTKTVTGHLPSSFGFSNN